MIAALLATLLAPNGVIAIDGMAVGVFENGKWKTADGGKAGRAKAYAASPAFELATSGSMKFSRLLLKFGHEDDPETLHAWYVEPFDYDKRPAAVWFGPKPTAPKMTLAKTDSPVYTAAVQNYLKGKGIKNPKPRLDSVVLVDLDANGTQEAVIFTTSRPHEEMWNALSLDGKEKHPNDFAAVLIRYVSGKTVKVVEAAYADGLTGSLYGFWQNRGIWNLDGVKGAELLIGSRYYEASGGMVVRFSNGKVIMLAEHVVGV